MAGVWGFFTIFTSFTGKPVSRASLAGIMVEVDLPFVPQHGDEGSQVHSMYVWVKLQYFRSLSPGLVHLHISSCFQGWREVIHVHIDR